MIKSYIIDRTIAFLLLVLLSPLLFWLLLITAIDLKCNPVFTQKRTINGRKVFRFYKIRSMYKNSPQIQTNLLKNPEKYITSWGKFLRKSSFDELLNLITIVEGNMNFIGPRPVIMSEIEMIQTRSRFNINSHGGITGLAQINGRDFITMDRKLAAEKYYEVHKSPRLRLFIIARTIQIVIRRRDVIH